VPLVFLFEAQGLRYSHFLIFQHYFANELWLKAENGHISAPVPQIKKIKALSFL
jgi:hypothetical protein